MPEEEMTIEGNRLKDTLSVANAETDKALAPVSPNGQAILVFPPWLGVLLTCVGILVAAVPGLVAAGISLPAWIPTAAATIGGILTVLGVNSAGTRK